MKGFGRCLAVVMLVGLLFTGCGQAAPEGEIFLRFGGEEVTAEEYRLLARDGIAIVQARFAAEYGVTVFDEAFWHTQFGGETPLEALMRYTEEALWEQKGLQLLAKAYGLTEDVSYMAFEAQLAAENEERRQAKEGGEAVYGPVSFTAEAYWSYRQSGLYYMVLEHLMYDVLQPEAAELEAFYETLRQEVALHNFTADCVYFYWPAGEGQEVLAALEQAARQGLGPDGMAAFAKEETGCEVGFARQQVDTRDLGKEDFERQRVVWMLEEIEAGGHTAVLEGEDTSAVIWVLEKTCEEMGPFAENRAYAEQEYREKTAKGMIEAFCEGFEIEYGRAFQELEISWLLG